MMFCKTHNFSHQKHKATAGVLLALSLGLVGMLPTQAADCSRQGLNTLIAGSGPDLTHNQVAIESNVRYVSRLLPTDARTRILFADGDPKTKSVLFLDPTGKSTYRCPQLPSLDGPNSVSEFDTQLQALTKAPETGTPDVSAPTPLLLYFTGHGSPQSGFDNNDYDMWTGNELSVQKLAESLKSLPASIPITLVMVQCYSGSFGNLLFQNADPKGPLNDRTVCGFFASIAQRPAAGCTPAVNEADYHDFTSYFFAALSGQDRQGHPITGADYNHDGKVGMNEAYTYTLIHDNSIDTPVCTSDVFLRRFVPLNAGAMEQVHYADLQGWADPAQRVALDEISKQLNLKTDDRVSQAVKRLGKINIESQQTQDVRLIRFVRLAKTVALAHTLALSPDTDLKEHYTALLAAEAGSPFQAPSRDTR